MTNVTKYAVSLPLALMATNALAGGMEKTALSTAFMYETGSYAELSFQNSDYDVSSSSGGNVSVVNDFTTTNFAFKFDFNDQLSFGVARYVQANIGLDYPNNWGGLGASSLPTALLDVDATVGLVRYEFSENISVLGGVKVSTIHDATLKVPVFPVAYGGPIDSAVSGDSETSYIYGVVYERSEIALRAELIREEEAAFSLNTLDGNRGSIVTSAGLPNYTTLNLQSGVAEDTLVFASARWADWSTHQVILGVVPLTSYEDTATYTVGVGRKFSDTLSGSLSYNWEEGSGPTSLSALAITDGYQGISAGVKYTAGDLTISGGVNFTSLGDVAVTGVGSFADNTVTTVGLRVGYHF